MSKFSVNLGWLFKELPFLERFEAAKAAGFDAVEIPAPYDVAVQEIQLRMALNDLRLVSMAAPPPNYTGGMAGYPADPANVERFRYDFKRALRFAGALRSEYLLVMAGVGSGAEARACYIENLRWAAKEAGRQKLLIEPACSKELPGHFLDSFDLARDVIEEVGAPNLRLQFDVYQAHAITGDVYGTWERVAPLVGHVQIAGLPERQEPHHGTFDPEDFLRRIAGSGYEGWVSAEYEPRGATADGLAWMRPPKRRRA